MRTCLLKYVFLMTPSLIDKLIQFLFPFLQDKFSIRQKCMKKVNTNIRGQVTYMYIHISIFYHSYWSICDNWRKQIPQILIQLFAVISKKYQEPEPEPLGKKIRSRVAWKKSQEPELLKNLPTPQPCSLHLKRSWREIHLPKT